MSAPAPDLATAAAMPVADLTRALSTPLSGLEPEEAGRRLARLGPNVIRARQVHPLAILAGHLKSPLLLLLAGAALTSYFTGQHADALIILGIVGLSVGLGFFNEYHSERTLERLHSRISHRAVVLRGGGLRQVDVRELVVGDLVLLDVGDIVPADLRLTEVHELECDEAVLTGESLPSAKTAAPVPSGASPLELASCAFMGTLVRGGTGRGLVVATGSATAFGRIALDLGRAADETSFQLGLRDFSLLLVRVTGILCVSIFVLNWLLGRPFLESLLFALAIAVGLTPQLLPAIVTISLAYGSQRLARQSVLVKRLISIEDLGNVEVLFTDKTGTLTEGRLALAAAVDPGGRASAEVLGLGLLCNSAAVQEGAVVGGNPLDRALWEAGTPPPAGWRKLDEAPFDYGRKLMSALVDDPGGRRLIVTKGAPEAVLERCPTVSAEARATLAAAFGRGARVVAVGTRPAPGATGVAAEDEHDLELAGFLEFSDPLKAGARGSLEKLKRLGLVLKVVTGDNGQVAAYACERLGLEVGETLSGAQLDALSDAQLAAALPKTTIFARVTPEQKSRIIRTQRGLGSDVGFLGDGVNDAVALHDADVGISVDSASDVAKDAADIVLLEKDLGILADGVLEGRRIFSNTIKYVLMGTSSNFGNMFSAAGASLFLPFLPMTPTQILLNNLLYDVSEMTIPTDNVDPELLDRPSRWDVGQIRRFMVIFGPLSSIFDFLTYGLMLFVFHARDGLFQTGWFVESLATQTLVIFVIRTRRVPFFRSRPSRPLLLTSLACVAVGAVLPYTPVMDLMGFRRLPAAFFVALAVMVVAYLGLVELAKHVFYRVRRPEVPLAVPLTGATREVRRNVMRWHRRPVRRPAG